MPLPLALGSTKFRSGVYGKGAYQQEQYRDLIGMGIFNSNPPLWKEQRRCAAMLFTADALKQHGQTNGSGTRAGAGCCGCTGMAGRVRGQSAAAMLTPARHLALHAPPRIPRR